MAWCHWRFVPPSFRGLRPWSPAVCRIFVALPPVQVVWQSLEKNRTNPGDIIGLMVKYVKSMVPIHHSFFFQVSYGLFLVQFFRPFQTFLMFFRANLGKPTPETNPTGPHLHPSPEASVDRCSVPCFLEIAGGFISRKSHGKAMDDLGIAQFVETNQYSWKVNETSWEYSTYSL